MGQDLYKESIDVPQKEPSDITSHESAPMLDNMLHPGTTSTEIRDLIFQIDISNLQDRSKGDAISKGIATLQVGWFILSCIYRGANHLGLTELEILTLASAIVSLILYLL